MRSLAADVAAINELRDSLDEDSVSKLDGDNLAVAFTVNAPHAAGTLHFTYRSGSEGQTAERPSLECKDTDDSILNLKAINAKLSDRGGIARALALLGRQLGIDLDWAEDAVGGARSDTEDDEDDVMAGSDGDDDGMSYEGGDNHDDEVLREWSRRLVHLEAIEEEATKAEEAAEGSASLDTFSQRQIFDPRAAFRRLVNELEEIFKAQDYNLMADASSPVGLFQWDVSLAGFRPDSPLAADMQMVGRKYGMSSVQLQISFKRGLHPFYPPSVRIISPRFHDPVLAAVASHPAFSADGWNPMMSAKEAILKIKSFLEEYARVNLDNEACSASSVAYLKAEHLTARLMALTGVPSIVNGKSLQQAFPEVFTPTDRGPAPGTAPANKKPRADEKPAAAAWKAGTGYGSGSTSKQDAIWDAKRAEAVQASRDAEACAVLESLAFEVREGLAAPPGAPGRGALLYVIRSGCLVQLLVRELSKAGFQDMTARVPYYSALFQCVEALTAQDTSALLEWHAEGDSNTVAAAVARLNSQAANFLRVVAQAGDDGAEGDRMHRTLPLPEDPKELSALFSGGKQAQAEVDVALAKYVVRVAAAVGAAAPGASGSRPPAAGAAGRLTRSQAAAAAAAGPSGSAGGENVDGRYVSVMAPFRVRMLANVAANHAFNADSEREATAPTKVRARRVASELASLESDLPVTTSSSVFVVADESKSVLWKAMITGPEDTPYAGGMFLFDIYFPAEYPSIAPKVRLRTTGGGSVRFNPNLYNEGKVCLSLLGTWSGGKGETWQADVSTILQVLLSIQSLIFVPEPYYNEPGYESRPDEKASNSYNATIMEATVRWAMLDQLRSPPAYFADAIRAHFRERKEAIVETVKGWIAFCKSKGYGGKASSMQTMLRDLEAELKKLK